MATSTFWANLTPFSLQLFAAFATFDADGSGGLSREETRRLVAIAAGGPLILMRRCVSHS